MPNQEGEVEWNAVVDLLREGKTAEIPCPKERDYERRTAQMLKRAERRGFTVEVLRGEGVLRVEPRPAAGGAVTAQNVGEGTDSAAEEQQRQERRDARRAERQAGRSRDE